MCGGGGGSGGGDGDDEGMAGDTGIGDDESGGLGGMGEADIGEVSDMGFSDAAIGAGPGGIGLSDEALASMAEETGFTGALGDQGMSNELAAYYASALGQHNVAMNTAALNAVIPGLGVFEQGIFGQAHEAIAMGEDLGSPTGYGEGGEGGGDDTALFNPFSSIVSPPVQPQPISPLSAEEEERRKIARRTGRKSTRLEELPWPPAVGRATLLGG